MSSSNNLDALFADAELPFGHPGRKFDDTPAHFEDLDDRYEPPRGSAGRGCVTVRWNLLLSDSS